MMKSASPVQYKIKQKNITPGTELIEAGLPTEFRCSLDPERTNAYHDYIMEHAKDKVVVDMGCGPGILSYLAVKAGAKKVYSIDVDTICLDTTHKIVPEAHIQKLNLATQSLPEADLYIHEIFGHYVFDEFFHKILWNMMQQGIDRRKIIPGKIVFYYNRLELTEEVTPDSEIEISYKPELYRPAIQEYHAKFAYLFENWTLLLEHIKELPYKEVDVGDDIWTWDITKRFDSINYCPDPIIFNCNAKDILQATKGKYNNIAWRVEMGDHVYHNTPREKNNWAPATVVGEHKKKRTYDYLKKYYNNPYKEEECQFLS